MQMRKTYETVLNNYEGLSVEHKEFIESAENIQNFCVRLFFAESGLSVEEIQQLKSEKLISNKITKIYKDKEFYLSKVRKKLEDNKDKKDSSKDTKDSLTTTEINNKNSAACDILLLRLSLKAALKTIKEQKEINNKTNNQNKSLKKKLQKKEKEIERLNEEIISHDEEPKGSFFDGNIEEDYVEEERRKIEKDKEKKGDQEKEKINEEKGVKENNKKEKTSLLKMIRNRKENKSLKKIEYEKKQQREQMTEILKDTRISVAVKNYITQLYDSGEKVEIIKRIAIPGYNLANTKILYDFYKEHEEEKEV